MFFDKDCEKFVSYYDLKIENERLRQLYEHYKSANEDTEYTFRQLLKLFDEANAENDRLRKQVELYDGVKLFSEAKQRQLDAAEAVVEYVRPVVEMVGDENQLSRLVKAYDAAKGEGE